MTRAIFYFIAATLLFLPLMTLSDDPGPALQLLFCLPFIIFLGIPHGAIDNILFLRNKDISNSAFITVYLIIISLNILLWLIFPTAAYVSFLIISAYHFGQSQFTHYLNNQKFIHKALHLCWGIALLSGLIYFNISEIQQIANQYSSFSPLGTINNELLMKLLLIFSGIVTLLLLIILKLKKELKTENIFMELIVFMLIMGCFYLLPLLVGFTLYFVILHSYKVMEEEFRYLKSEKVVINFKGFIYLLTPFSLFSIFGIIFLFALIYFNLLAISYGYLVLIIISSITLPHVFVMNNFYKRLYKKNFFK